MIKPPAQSSIHLLAQETVTTGAAEGCVKDKIKSITFCAARLFDAGQLMIGCAP